MPKVPSATDSAARRLRAWMAMTVSLPIRPERKAFGIAHESVCTRCGHGESLHPMRDLACLICDQRASAGLPSLFCVGFLSDRVETSTVRV